MERTCIRRLMPGDETAFLQAIRLNCAYLSEWIDTPSRIVTIEDARSEISAGPTRWGCFVDKDLVASVKAVPTAMHDCVEIGVWGAAAHQGHGHVRATLLSALAGLLQLGTRIVVYRHARENTRSLSLISNLSPPGFTITCDESLEEFRWTLHSH